MEQQTLNERRQLLQSRIFAHATAHKFNPYSQAVLSQISRCHTARIGVHHYRCNNAACDHRHYQYHSCGNRHCPSCGGARRDQWIEDRMSELLPTTYFHVVCTLPQELRSLCMGNRKLLFGLLFKAARHTLLTLGADEKYIGATPGIVSILHTHGQDLCFHPHVHNIVSGGGITKAGKWVQEKRANGKFLFPRRAMEQIYKGYFLAQLSKYLAKGILQYNNRSEVERIIEVVSNKKWNVYAKAPFGGPEQIVEYLGRYTHKVAITAHRILHISDTHIRFKYKDYADGNKQRMMELTHVEFLRRYEQHILPSGFMKIRHSGYLHARDKMQRIAQVCEQLALPAPMPRVQLPASIRLLIQTGQDVSLCPRCKTGRLQLVQTLIYHNGALVDVADLRSRGSPSTIKRRSYDKS